MKAIIFVFIILFAILEVYSFDDYSISEKSNYDEYKEPIDSEKYINKLDQLSLKCLNAKKINETLLLKMTLEEKLEAFKKSDCPPLVVLPGFLGSKMEFRMKSCSEFKTFHPNIMKTCGWKDCHDPKLNKFPIWINTDLDLTKVISIVFGDKDTRRNTITESPYLPHFISNLEVNENVIEYKHQKACFGSLFRLYFERDENRNYKLTNLKGAEIRVKQSNKKECGLDVVSNYLGPLFSVSRVFKGFSKLDEFLTRMGYNKGISLFYHPYDFRLPIDKLIRRINNTVKIAYKITKKKPIIIGHSLGGLLSYKYSLLHSNLVERVITIGSPFLGTMSSLDSILTNRNLVKTETEFNIYGFDVKLKAEVDDDSMKLLYGSFHSVHLLPKQIKNDSIDDKIKLIDTIEKNRLNNYSPSQTIEANNLKDDEKNLINYFYSLFPFDKCTSLRNLLEEKSHPCQINFSQFSVIKDGKKYTSYDELFEQRIEEIQPTLNKGVDEIFKIEADTFTNYLFNTTEKDLFEYKQPNVPFTFIYSNHMDSLTKVNYEKEGKSRYTYAPGDGTVPGFSQIYPGLRWLVSNFNRNETYPVQFVEYCSLDKKKGVKNYMPNESGFTTLTCDCMEQPLNPKQFCSHSSMIGDTNFVMFIGDIIIKSKSKQEIIPGYEDLYEKPFQKNFICSNLD